jgi:hypothetical protein
LIGKAKYLFSSANGLCGWLHLKRPSCKLKTKPVSGKLKTMRFHGYPKSNRRLHRRQKGHRQITGIGKQLF